MPQQSSNLKDALHRFAPVVFWAGIIVLVLGVGGWWLDQRLHSGGICAFVGTVVGFIAGIVALLQVIRQLNR